jgi:hypothetical protein
MNSGCKSPGRNEANSSVADWVRTCGEQNTQNKPNSIHRDTPLFHCYIVSPPHPIAIMENEPNLRGRQRSEVGGLRETKPMSGVQPAWGDLEFTAVRRVHAGLLNKKRIVDEVNKRP